MAKRYEELTISDDFIFGKTMGDKVLCHDVLERMLEKRVGTLEDIQPQREFQYAVDGKPVRLDMYARDRKSYRELPEEIQTSPIRNTRSSLASSSSIASRMASLYNSSLISTNLV